MLSEEGYRRSGVSLAMRYRLSDTDTFGLKGLWEGAETIWFHMDCGCLPF